MKNENLSNEVVTLLSRVEFSANWTQPPEVMHIPFMGSREYFFLLVTLYVKQGVVDREALLGECISSARIIVNSGLMTSEKALEIAIYVADQKKIRRVIRLIILSTALDQITKIDARDLLDQSYQWITCQWPLSP